MNKITLIKLGGSFITDKEKPYTINKQNIDMAIEQIKEISLNFPNKKFILGNGAGSYGHYAVIDHQIQDVIKTTKDKLAFAKVHSSVKKLNLIIANSLLEKGVPVFSIQPSAIISTKNGNLNHLDTTTIFGLLNHNIIPFVHGDMIYDHQKGNHILSTENIFKELINKLSENHYEIEKIIYITKVKGVVDKNNNIIKKITQTNFSKIKNEMISTQGFDVTGGMLHKIENSLKIAEKNIPIFIGNINKENSLVDIIKNNSDTGTWIL